MKCFISKYKGGFGGGVVLVAANSAEEALDVARKNVEYPPYNEFIIGGCWFLPMSEFEEVEGLRHDTKTPCVILNNVYIE